MCGGEATQTRDRGSVDALLFLSFARSAILDEYLQVPSGVKGRARAVTVEVTVAYIGYLYYSG